MKDFFAGRRWPPGTCLPHVHYLPDADALRPLLDAYEPLLAAEKAVSIVPGRWLHATCVKVATPLAEIAADQ